MVMNMKPDARFPIRRFCGLVFAAAWSCRFLIAMLTDSVHNVVRKDMVREALSLVQTGVLGNLCLTPTGPSALQPPGYVLVLAAIFHFFGTGTAAEVTKVLLCITVSSIRCALVPFLAYRFGLSRLIVITSGVIGALWIGALGTELQGDWDAPITSVLLIILTYLHFLKPVAESGHWRAGALGILWGLAALFNPTVLEVLAGIALLEAIRAGRGRIPVFARRSAILCGCLLFTLFPWALRNKLSLGQYIWTRDTMPFSLYISYRDGAHWSDAVNTRPSLGHPDRPNHDDVDSPCPWVNPNESRKMGEMGELTYLKDLDEKAIRWIRTHPAESLRLFAQHAFYFWFPPGAEFYRWQISKWMVVYSAARGLLTLLAIGGWIMLFRVRRHAALLLGVILLMFPLAYYVVNWSSRYRAPMEWVLVLLAAVSISTVTEWIGRAVRNHNRQTATTLSSLA
jgi:hypothetical protein